MNDFDARARSAARAVHDLVASGDASADAPAVDTVAVPPRTRHTMRALLAAAAAVVLVAAIVGGVIVTNKDDGPTAAEVTAFCDAATAAIASGTGFTRDLAALAPVAIRDDTAYVVAERSRISSTFTIRDRGRLAASASAVYAWIETYCFPAAAQPGAAPADQRFAPIPIPGTGRVCSVTNGPPGSVAPDPGHITVYASGPDGPFLAVATTTTSLIEDDALSTTLLGLPGARVGVLSDTEGRALTDSQAIEWDGAERSITIAGRHLPPSIDLAALAGQVVDNGTTATLPDQALGGAWSRVYEGSVSAIRANGDPSFRASDTFSVSTGEGTLFPNLMGSGSGASWFGAVGDRATVGATRLFLADPTIERIGRRETIQWTTGDGRPPTTFARWAEPDGVVITAAVFGDEPTAKRRERLGSLVRSMRKLDREHWTDLTKQFSYCGLLGSRASSASGGSSSADVIEGPITEPPTTTITGPPAP